MTSPQRLSLSIPWMRAYAAAYTCHGDLDLSEQDYCSRLETILQKHLGQQPSLSAAAACFESLHTSDLYLAMACARQNPNAWERFLLLYGDYLQTIARFVTQAQDLASEIASNLPGHL